jgi:hypothetical protein
MMMATTMKAATSESARSNAFDLGVAVMSGGGMAYVGGVSSLSSQPRMSDSMGSFDTISL